MVEAEADVEVHQMVAICLDGENPCGIGNRDIRFLIVRFGLTVHLAVNEREVRGERYLAIATVNTDAGRVVGHGRRVSTQGSEGTRHRTIAGCTCDITAAKADGINHRLAE